MENTADYIGMLVDRIAETFPTGAPVHEIAETFDLDVSLLSKWVIQGRRAGHGVKHALFCVCAGRPISSFKEERGEEE